jgi:hypothetical protein
MLGTFFVVSVCILPRAGFANDIYEQDSTLKNTDDVSRAKEIAKQVASQPASQVIAALQAEEKAAKELQEAIQAENSLLIDKAQKAHRVTEAAAQIAMAAFSGVKPADITSLRNSDMDWGQIVQTLGIHPDAIGPPQTKGNVSRYQSEMTPATSRDLKSGRSMMDGFPSGSNSGHPSMDTGHRSQNYGDWDHMNGGSKNGMANDHGGSSGSGMGGGHGDNSGGSGGGMGGGHGGDSGGSGGGMGGGHGGDSGGSGGGMGGGHW